MRILLVDEDISQHSQFATFINQLGAKGYRLSWCSSFEHAPDSMCSTIYDVIFLDATIDDSVSRHLLSVALENGCDTPIVILSDSLQVEVRNKLLSLGAVDYLNKGQIEAAIFERVIRYAAAGSPDEQKSAQLANIDPLTGMPNRMLFLEHLARTLRGAEKERRKLALFSFDLDSFQQVNDSFGHEEGDKLIEKTADRLRRCVSRTDSVGRIGGDEFALLIEDNVHTQSIIKLAQSISDIMAPAIEVDGHALNIGASFGIAIYPQAGMEIDSLLRSAGLARQRAKVKRGISYCFYDELIDAEVAHRLNREASLRAALKNNEFRLLYQPRVDLVSGATLGVEALIRWENECFGLVTPDEFIPLAEEVGLIGEIGYWVVTQACSDIRKMDELGMPPLEVALNISFEQFQDDGFSERVTQIIQHSGIDPHRLEFELTETTIMSNTGEAERAMHALSQLGSTFSLDDFGTGYSSFAHIQRLPINALKIDRSFIQNVTDNVGDAAIVRSIISLAHSLDMIVVAEGAETQAQVEFLQANACDQVQGYYFSPPLAFGALYDLIDQEDVVIV